MCVYIYIYIYIYIHERPLQAPQQSAATGQALPGWIRQQAIIIIIILIMFTIITLYVIIAMTHIRLYVCIHGHGRASHNREAP